MNKFRITTAIAATALFTFGLAAGSVSASVEEINGQCYDIDGNGYPHPVDCPPELELPGPTDPFAGRCYEETFRGLEIPVPCPEDDEDRSFVPILPGTYTPLPGTITFPWLGGSGDGEEAPAAEEEAPAAEEEAPAAEEEAPAAEEEAAVDESGDDGSDLIPDVEGAVIDTEIAEEAPVEESPVGDSPAEVESDAPAEADDAEDIEISTEVSEPAPPVADEPTKAASSDVAEAAAVSTNESVEYPISDILIDEAGEATEVVEASFEIASSAPADAPVASSADSAVDAVSPEVIVEDAAEQSSSLGLIAAIMLVLLGGGGLAGVGVLATRKQN